MQPLKTVVYSSDEVETGGNFENAQTVIPLRHTLETVYLHQQINKGSTIINKNITSQDILTYFIKPLRSITFDMR